jgi:hypothetical protein
MWSAARNGIRIPSQPTQNMVWRPFCKQAHCSQIHQEITATPANEVDRVHQ